jgi:DNA polymerase III subunit gamma/tau
MQHYLVSARKYRPMRFEDVVGQGHVSDTLKNALRTEHLAHAFLFCGPRGVGKTTCARILAKLINCTERSESLEPCGKCASCISFTNNASFNIVELDAASNNSVEHIRNLVDQVRIPPQSGKYKVFIIDEVHMLSQAAFNAFLKTLEEPPEYAIFILATTEKHKILPTILSRCQIYDFKRITIPEIVGHLQYIAGLEGIETDEKALHIIARKADGALRDALSIFDRLVSGGNGSVKYQQVLDQLNILDYEVFMQITDSFLTQQMPLTLTVFNETIQKGFEPDTFILGLAEHFRNLLMAKNPQTVLLMDIPDSLKERYLDQSAMTSSSFLISGLDILNEADIHYKTARNRRLFAEITLIKLCFLNSVIEREVYDITEEKKTPRTTSIEKLDPVIQLEPEVSISKPIVSTVNEEPELKQIIAKPEKISVRKSVASIKNLDELLREVEEEEKYDNERSSTLTQDTLIAYWQFYTANCNSPSTKLILEQSQPVLEENQIKVKVGSQLAKSTILQEIELMDYIRTESHSPTVILQVEIAPELAQEDKSNARPVSTIEKYQHLVAKNPLVENLVKSLHLKPDE